MNHFPVKLVLMISEHYGHCMCLRNLSWESMILFIAQRLLPKAYGRPWWWICGILCPHLLFKVKTIVFSRCGMDGGCRFICLRITGDGGFTPCELSNIGGWFWVFHTCVTLNGVRLDELECLYYISLCYVT